jgi:hypothetical protein
MNIAAITIVLLGLIAFTNPQREFYLICAASWLTCFISVFLLVTRAGLLLAIIGVPLGFISIIGMFGLVGLTVLMSLILIILGAPSPIILVATGVVYYLLAFVTGIGLVLTITNRHLPNVDSPKLIFLSNWYFLFPVLFIIFVVISLLKLHREATNIKPSA